MELSNFECDAEGFLKDREDWTFEFARLVTEAEGLEPTDELDNVVTWARQWYEDNAVVPTVREFNKGYCKGKGRSEAKQLLTSLTNGTGMKLIAKIAGLPKPTGCV